MLTVWNDRSILQMFRVWFRSGWNYTLGAEPTFSELELSLDPAKTGTMCEVSASWATGLCREAVRVGFPSWKPGALHLSGHGWSLLCLFVQ